MSFRTVLIAFWHLGTSGLIRALGQWHVSGALDEVPGRPVCISGRNCSFLLLQASATSAAHSRLARRVASSSTVLPEELNRICPHLPTSPTSPHTPHISTGAAQELVGVLRRLACRGGWGRGPPCASDPKRRESGASAKRTLKSRGSAQLT